MTDSIGSIAQLFVAQSRALLRDEYPTKLRKALDALPEGALWWRPDERSNSIGNLLMHLEGNVRQWIVGGVGFQQVERDRAGEFAAREGASLASLWERLNRTLQDADNVIAEIRPADLSARRTIQGRDTTVLEAVYHVVEHFGMHAGQIILLAKQLAPGAIRFYEDSGGLARPLWKEGAEKFTE